MLKNRNLTKREMAIALLMLAIFATTLSIGFYNKKQHYQGHEPSTIGSLKAIANSQAVFIKTDYYKLGTKVYANPKDGGGISDLFEVGFDGGNGTSNALNILDRTVAQADDSNPNPMPKSAYLFRDLKCGDYTKQYAVVAYPNFYGVKISYLFLRDYGGRNIYIINETGIIYQIDAKVLYPDIKEGDKIPLTLDTYPTAKELKNWIPAGR